METVSIFRKSIYLARPLRFIFKKLGIAVIAIGSLQNLQENANKSVNFDFLSILESDNVGEILKIWGKSKSQIRQDLFVISELNLKQNGYFVEFGATNGVDLSNTFLLEKEFNWSGILAEPAKHWQVDLANNRNCNIERLCVWKNSGDFISFAEAEIKELSTISQFSDLDKHGKSRKHSDVYRVETISLNDLLLKFDAPKLIDYLSIDTEGSEFEILQTVDFKTWNFRVITVEHNFSENRERIFHLLSENGYKRKFEEISLWDDWYVKE
jgi:FkbM family methyltransferase